MTEKVKKATWFAWVTLPVLLFAVGGLVSLAVGMLGAVVAGIAWALGARIGAACIMAVAGMPLGVLMAIATVYWTDKRKARLRAVGL